MADENASGLGAFDLPLRFPGQRYDTETGLHYNYFRNYDPSLGRYAESDPIGLAAGPNGYSYARSGPLRFTDSKGQMALAEVLIIGTAIIVAAYIYSHEVASNGNIFSQSNESDESSECDEAHEAQCDKEFEFDERECYDRYGNGLWGDAFTSNLHGCLQWATRRRIACYRHQPDPGPYPGFQGDNGRQGRN